MSGPTNETTSSRNAALGATRAAEIVQKLRPIVALRMRCVILSEHVATLTATAAVDALAALVSRATRRNDADYLLALECLIAMLSDPALLPYQSRAALYAAAKERGHDAIRRLLFEISPDLSPGATLAGPAETSTGERSVVPTGRPLTLGERKSLARAHQRDLLSHLLRDPHPDVIRILLGNPHLTEADVLSLASRRPASGAALSEIAASQRWIARYPVKRALVKNPYTPLVLAIRLATTLRPGDLRDVAGDPRLNTLLREHAAGLVASP
ncbi:MAG: hypothetical protein MJE77_07710 [Proteobacteria bacterium]|nr:hypothetical protein [Pseudomonadota bacterium]